MPELPTCWYCPECGYVCSVETAHARWTDINRGNVSAGFCPGSMVEVPIVPPAASLEQRHAILRLLYEVVAQYGPEDNYIDRYIGEDELVFVVRHRGDAS